MPSSVRAPHLAIAIVAWIAPYSPAAAHTQTEDAKLVGHEAGRFDFFGGSLALQGRLVVVGACELSFPDFGPGSVYIFEEEGPGWVQRARLRASDGGPGQTFGRSVALDGDTLLVGSDQDSQAGVMTGTATVFERTGSGWERRARLFPRDGAAGDLFGWSVALAGERALIGAWRDEGASGSAYVFVRAGGTWSQEAKLTALDAAPDDQLGFSVAIQGKRALVGANGDDDAGQDSGAVYVFRRDGSRWIQEAELSSPAVGPGARFGTSVALAAERALAGAPGADVAGQPLGSAHVFIRSGQAWSEEVRLVAPAPDSGTDIGFGFGRSVALAAERAVVGEPSGAKGGAIHVFERVRAGWVQLARLEPTDNASGQLFGQAAASEGLRVVASSPFGQGLENASGAAYVFDVGTSPGRAFCLGDGSLDPCPCANESRPNQGAGCRNSTLGAARLVAAGSASLGRDDLEFRALALPPGVPLLLALGASASNATTFGDGLLCVRGQVRRIATLSADRSGRVVVAPGLGAMGGLNAGETRGFQGYYRDTSGPCGAGFNATNAVEVTFGP